MVVGMRLLIHLRLFFCLPGNGQQRLRQHERERKKHRIGEGGDTCIRLRCGVLALLFTVAFPVDAVQDINKRNYITTMPTTKTTTSTTDNNRTTKQLPHHRHTHNKTTCLMSLSNAPSPSSSLGSSFPLLQETTPAVPFMDRMRWNTSTAVDAGTRST